MKKSTKKWLIIVLAIEAVIIAGYGLYRRNSAVSVGGAPAAATATASRAVKYKYTRQSGAATRGTYTVDDTEPKSFRLVFESQIMINVKMSGSFKATRSVELLLLNSDNLSNWRKGQPYTAVYESGKTSSAQLDVSIPDPGLYYLVFSNKSPTPATITADIGLEYDFGTPE